MDPIKVEEVKQKAFKSAEELSDFIKELKLPTEKHNKLISLMIIHREDCIRLHNQILLEALEEEDDKNE